MKLNYTSLGSEIEIQIPELYDSIGICMSGGMDSAMLVASLFPHLELEKVKIFVIDKGTSVEYVKGLLEYMQYDAEVELIVVPLMDQPNGNLSGNIVTLLDSVDYLYTGSTQNPPWADDIPKNQKPHRHPAVQWKNMLYPFGLSHKSNVLDIMRQADCLHLLPLTHTCTERPHANCGKCFACLERKWAFEEVGLADVAIYE